MNNPTQHSALRTSHCPRVIIIGGGPAGSVAGLILARAGFAVTLIEQHRFPREKVCGECLSATGIQVLARLGLDDAVASLSPVRLRRAIFHDQSGRSLTLQLPAEMWGISRAALDSILLDAARQAGARVLQPARCEALCPNVRIRRLDTNALVKLSADHVLLADGKGALLPARSANTGDLGMRVHLSNVDAAPNAIELFGVAGHYAGLAPIENGLFNLAWSVPARRAGQFSGDLHRLLAEMLDENPSLQRRLAGARLAGDILASPLPRFANFDDWPDGVIPIGNAACSIEPIGGEGIGLAMRSAELAAGALIESRQNRRPLDIKRLQTGYRRLWGSRPLACRAAARIISSPAVAPAAMDWLSTGESLSAAWMKLAGK